MTLPTPRPLADILAEQAAQDVTATVSAMPYHVAMVIDGVVQQVFHVDERLGAVLLSNPTLVQCESPANGGPDSQWKYDATTNTFSKPE